MANVRIIPKEKELPKIMRVAAYARVSSDKDQMLHSLATQVSYFSKMIQSHDSWQYVGVYSDEGMTGTKSTRGGFMKMVQDAKDGKIDIIVTKSLSRFARNTVDCLKTIRELKAINVDIFFEEQNIHTLSANGEFLISLLAGYAQEESRQCSENTLWRVKKNFTEGKPYGGQSCVGYKLEKGKYFIVEEEASIIRKMFDLYINGFGSAKIANILNEEGVPAYYGGLWNKTTISHIISNPIYKGDLLLQKTYRDSYLTKKHLTNRGEKPMYYVEDNHEPIVSKEIFDKAQEVREQRLARIKSPSPKKNYPFSGMIKCGICGHSFKHKVTPYYEQWICCEYDQRGKKYCDSHQIRDDVLRKACADLLGINDFNETLFKKQVKSIVAYNDNRLSFHFNDGRDVEIKYSSPSRKDSWNDDMKKAAKERSLMLHAKRKNNTK